MIGGSHPNGGKYGSYLRGPALHWGGGGFGWWVGADTHGWDEPAGYVGGFANSKLNKIDL